MGQVAARADLTEIAVNSFRAALAIDPHCQQARAGLDALRVEERANSGVAMNADRPAR